MTAPIDYLSQIDSHTLRLIDMAFEEDHVSEDYTTLWSVPAQVMAAGKLIACQSGVFCTGPLFAAVFQRIEPAARITLLAEEGGRIEPNRIVAEIEGRARTILAAERTALNLVGRFSGVSTLTAKYVEGVEGTRARIRDTRKTTPLWRKWEKYAVTQGGGVNHRDNLSDRILLKDNHVSLFEGIVEAYRAVKQNNLTNIPVEIEVDRLDQLEEILKEGPEEVLLDNFSIPDLVKAVELTSGKSRVEASGGINLQTVRAVAETGVDYIAVGALTHSAPAFDFSLEIVIKSDDHLDKPNPTVV